MKKQGSDIVICGCGARADCSKSPRAWDGWQVVPFAVCPQCIERDMAMRSVKVTENKSFGKVIRTLEPIAGSQAVQ